MSRWAVHLLRELHDRHDIAGPDLATLGTQVGVPTKYIARATALLTRAGLASLRAGGDLTIGLTDAGLRSRKPRAAADRRPPTRAERKALISLDDHKCAMCGKMFPPDQLQIDHVVPLALRGADEPGNWVAMCAPDNSRKRSDFAAAQIKFYRGRPVRGSVGVRFRDGYFWPFINGKVRAETR